jgi:hypothetical protein
MGVPCNSCLSCTSLLHHTPMAPRWGSRATHLCRQYMTKRSARCTHARRSLPDSRAIRRRRLLQQHSTALTATGVAIDTVLVRRNWWQSERKGCYRRSRAPKHSLARRHNSSAALITSALPSSALFTPALCSSAHAGVCRAAGKQVLTWPADWECRSQGAGRACVRLPQDGPRPWLWPWSPRKGRQQRHAQEYSRTRRAPSAAGHPGGR